MSFESRIDRFCARHPGAPRDDILATRLLFRTARLLREHINQALAPFDLNMSQYLVLSMLSVDEGQPSSPSALGDTMDATRTQMTRILDSLQTRGLIKRRTSEQDRRSLDLELTPSGRKALEAAVPTVLDAYAQAWAVLDRDTQAAATAGLRQLHAGLDSTRS